MRRFALFILLLIIGAACSPIMVTTHYEKTTSFHQYKSFKFYGWPKMQDDRITDEDRKLVEDAVKENLAKKGWVYNQDTADVVVSLFILLDVKTGYDTYRSHYGTGAYGGFYDPYYGWFGYNARGPSSYEQHEYTEGSLIIDMFDTATQKQLWQGVGTDYIDRRANNRRKYIYKHVNKVLNKLPL